MDSKSSKEKIFIGVAWPYVNGDIHVGHVAGYLLPADILARFYRARGHRVLMASGSDCFGTPITVQSEKEGITPQEVVEKYHPRIVKLFSDLNLSFDIYTKTTTENHKRIVQDVLSAFWEENLISIKTQEQYYSPTSERFLPDRYVEGTCPYCGYEQARSDQCDECGKLLDQDLLEPQSKLDQGEVVLKETTHAFIEWGKLQEQIGKYVNARKDEWRGWVRAETESWLRDGLQARPVTRDLSWGVPVPEDIAKELPNSEDKRIYVWFDAVTGYLSASREWSGRSEENDWRDFWYGDNLKHYYFMGKDNLVFHTIFWPGQLMVYDDDLHLPDVQAISQFLDLEGEPFSKSRGVTVDTQAFIDKYGADSLRFYLLTITPENDDASFYWEEFFQTNNSVLVGHIGNYVHRTLSLYAPKNPPSQGGRNIQREISSEVLAECKKALQKSIKHLEACEFKKYWSAVDGLAKFANGYINNCEPWVTREENPEKFARDGGDLVVLTYALMLLLAPVTPQAAKRYFQMVGLSPEQSWPDPEDFGTQLTAVLGKITLQKPVALFEKFERE